MMNRATLEAILPQSNKGANGEICLSKNCYSSGNARSLYEYLKLSLLDVNNWNTHKSGITINSRLMDRNGRQVGRIARTGDRIKINRPRWQSLMKVYDWFEIRKVEERLNGNMEFFFLTIGPSMDPLTEFPCPPEFLKEPTVTLFIIRDEHTIEIQIHTRGQRTGFGSSLFKKRIEHVVNALSDHRQFYIRQWGKLLKSILSEGASNFPHFN